MIDKFASANDGGGLFQVADAELPTQFFSSAFGDVQAGYADRASILSLKGETKS